MKVRKIIKLLSVDELGILRFFDIFEKGGKDLLEELGMEKLDFEIKKDLEKSVLGLIYLSSSLRWKLVEIFVSNKLVFGEYGEGYNDDIKDALGLSLRFRIKYEEEDREYWLEEIMECGISCDDCREKDRCRIFMEHIGEGGNC